MTFVKEVSCANSRIIQGLKAIRSAVVRVIPPDTELELERWDAIVVQLERIHLHLYILLGYDGEQIDTGPGLIPKRGSVISAPVVVEEDEDLADLFHVRDEKAANTDGGSLSSGSWQTRDLNTVLTNEITGASLASDQITLPAGTYEIFATAPMFDIDRHKARLWDTTNTIPLIIGTSSFTSKTSSHTQTIATVRGRFTLSAEAVLELQHQGQTTQNGNGLGLASNFGVVEVYAEVMIKKIS